MNSLSANCYLIAPLFADPLLSSYLLPYFPPFILHVVPLQGSASTKGDGRRTLADISSVNSRHLSAGGGGEYGWSRAEDDMYRQVSGPYPGTVLQFRGGILGSWSGWTNDVTKNTFAIPWQV